MEEGLKYHLEKGIITETGLPTRQAIKDGLVKDYYEDEGLSFDEFLRIYLIFKEYDEALFQCIDG